MLKRLKKNPGSQSVWEEAKAILGRGRGVNLPECTTNSNANTTAEHQNQFFVNKIANLVASLSKKTFTVKHVSLQANFRKYC